MRSLFLITFLLLTGISIAREGNKTAGGETITTFTGDKLTFSVVKERPVNIKGKKTVHLIVDKPVPVLLNGNKIYYHFWDDNDGVYDTKAQKNAIEEHSKYNMMMDKAVEPYKKGLRKGDYVIHLKNMVVSKQGNIVYYETEGLQRFDNKYNSLTNPVLFRVKGKLSENINTVITLPIPKMQFTPLILDGKNMAYLSGFSYYFSID